MFGSRASSFRPGILIQMNITVNNTTCKIRISFFFYLSFLLAHSPRLMIFDQRMIILRVLCIKFINHKKLFKLIFLSKYLVPGFYGECRFSLAVRSIIILLRKSIFYNNPTITECKSVLEIRK